MSGVKSLLRRLRRSVSGLATTELALSLPFLLTGGLWGVELANYGVTLMRVNQLAIHMADNASRVGDTSMLANRKVYEADIMDLLAGTNIQGGGQIDFFENGRAIISSLQVDEDDNQYIAWQRCLGLKRWVSSYGTVGDRLASGMGPSGREVVAFGDEAVMFVELAYDYQPLISGRFVGTPEILSVASFTVRSDRDLSGLFQRDPTNPDPVAECTTYSNPFPPFGGSGGSGGSSGGTSGSSGGSGGGSGGGGGGGGGSGGGGGGTSTTSGGSTTSTTTGGTSSWGGSTTTTSGGTSSWGGSSSWGGGSSSRGGGSGGSGGRGSSGWR
jgi:hypothetical protein